jgi:hypothetical protein
MNDPHRPLNHDELTLLRGLISEHKSHGITHFDWELMADDLKLPYPSVEREGERIEQEELSGLNGDAILARKDQNPSASAHILGPIMSVPRKENYLLE